MIVVTIDISISEKPRCLAEQPPLALVYVKHTEIIIQNNLF
jgi:hypothetical protein